MNRLVVAVALLSACGRVAFDQRDVDARADDDTAPACGLADDFSAGTGTWQGPWTVRPNSGPDSSDGFGATNVFEASGELAWHPTLQAIATLDLSLDFSIEHPNGDLNVMLLKPGWVDNSADGYDIAVLPAGGDSSPDQIKRNVGGVGMLVAMHTPSVRYNEWHRVRVVKTSGSIRVDLDGTAIMETTDVAVPPPYDVVFRIYFGATIDNLTSTCTR